MPIFNVKWLLMFLTVLTNRMSKKCSVATMINYILLLMCKKIVRWASRKMICKFNICCLINDQFKVKSCIQTDIFRAIIFHAILFYLNWLGLAMKSNIYLKHYNFQMVSWRPMAETSHEIKQFPYTSRTVVRGKIDLRETLFTAYRILNAYLGVCVSRFGISMLFHVS